MIDRTDYPTLYCAVTRSRATGACNAHGCERAAVVAELVRWGDHLQYVKALKVCDEHTHLLDDRGPGVYDAQGLDVS